VALISMFMMILSPVNHNLVIRKVFRIYSCLPYFTTQNYVYGKLIAHTLSAQRPIYTNDDGSAWGELHVVDRAGQSRPFITGKVSISSTKWTPDGKDISSGISHLHFTETLLNT